MSYQVIHRDGAHAGVVDKPLTYIVNKLLGRGLSKEQLKNLSRETAKKSEGLAKSKASSAYEEFAERAMQRSLSRGGKGAKKSTKTTRSAPQSQGSGRAQLYRLTKLDIEKFTKSANESINKEGLTAAARAFSKHASNQRASGTFPKLSGNIQKQNETARKIVNDILQHPKKVVEIQPSGNIHIRAPNGKGVSFYNDGVKTNGLTGSKQRFYDWDYTHGDIEVYGKGGKEHLGTIDPVTGKFTKKPVPGRNITDKIR